MAIKIKGKYTNPKARFFEKQGLYDIEPTTIVIEADGTVTLPEGKNELNLGYVGEDRVRIINIDTRKLHWGKQVGWGLKVEKDLADYYSPRVVFFNPKENRRYFKRDSNNAILVQEGQYQVYETNKDEFFSGIPNPFMIKADENYFYIPDEVTDNLARYEIVYTLIEKQEGKDDPAQGNIEDCTELHNEVFVSSVFYGSTKQAGKELFDKHTGGYYDYCGKNTPDFSHNKGFLHKQVLVCNLDKGELKIADEKPFLFLGYQGDVFITPFKITLPLPKGVWTNKAAETKIEVIFSRGNGDSLESFLIQPNITDADIVENNHLNIICWVPYEVTEQTTNNAEKWKIAMHLWTEMEPFFEVYTTVVEGEVGYTFLEAPIADEEDRLDPLYQVQGTTLIVAGEDWIDEQDDQKGDLDMWGPEDRQEEGETFNLGIHQV